MTIREAIQQSSVFLRYFKGNLTTTTSVISKAGNKIYALHETINRKVNVYRKRHSLSTKVLDFDRFRKIVRLKVISSTILRDKVTSNGYLKHRRSVQR